MKVRDPRKPPKKTGKARVPADARGASRNSDPSGEKAANSDDLPSREEVVNRTRDPVTNQDEQEKITNSGDDDIPVPKK